VVHKSAIIISRNLAMRCVFLAAAMLTAAVPATAIAQEAPAPAAAAAKYSTATTTIKALLANEATKAVIVKHMPQITEAPLDMIGDQTLKALQAMAGDMLPDKLLADIDADLAKIK
jgi:hypothetical protein